MNSKMTTNSQLSTTEPEKQKQKTNQANNQNKNRIREMEITWRVISGEGENGGKGTGNKKHKWQVQNRQGEVKNSIGNGEAKELICKTHGHELRQEMLVVGGYRTEGNKGKEKNGTTLIA